MRIPELIHDFSDAWIDGIEFGPRREFTLKVLIPTRTGPTPSPPAPVAVRFGGVENLDQVRSAFRSSPQKVSELRSLRYSDDKKSKPGKLFVTLDFERVDLRLEVRCSSISLSQAEA